MKITNIPNDEQKSKDFKATLNGVTAELYQVRVSAMPFNCVWPGHQRSLDQTETASVLSFTMDKPVEVELTAEKDFEEVIIRPLSKKIVPTVTGRTIRFTIEKAGQYTVELDGIHNPLFIFASADKEWEVCKEDKDVIYFGAGVHDVGLIELTDGQTLYIDQDAVVYGYVRAILAKNIRILGYGVLDGSKAVRADDTLLVSHDFTRRNPENDRYSPFLQGYPLEEIPEVVVGSNILKDKESFIQYLNDVKMVGSCVQLYGCENVEMSGIILRDSVGFTCTIANCENVVCNDLKIVGMWRYNADGIDIFNSKNCTIKNCFLRNFDDCVVLKGIIGWDTWNMENILVENCVVWCDWGRALEIGAETAAPEYRNIIFRDCDVIHASAVAIDLFHHDRAYIHHIAYENIRVEYSKYDAREKLQPTDDAQYTFTHNVPPLITIHIPKGRGYSSDYLKGQVRDVYYKDIQVLTDNEDNIPAIRVWGYDETHIVDRVSFTNITVNGKPYPIEKGIHKNEFVGEVTWNK